MLSENQVERLLAQCEKVDKAYGNTVPTGLQTEWTKNVGWIQALRLVLEEDTYPIRNTPLKEIK